MADQFIEDLPDGGNLQPTDLLYFQRNIAGTWNDFNIRAGAVNGVNVLVHQAVYTEADVIGGNTIILFSVPFDKVAVFLPGAFVKCETPTPTSFAEYIQIGSVPDQLTANWTNTNTTEYLSFQAGPAAVQAGVSALEITTNIGLSVFTLTVSLRYVLVSV
jgi:hypothetical protein